MNKTAIVQALFEKYYISKQDCIDFLLQSGASEEQLEDFKRKNARLDKREQSRGFPEYYKEIEHTPKLRDEGVDKFSNESAVHDSTRVIDLF